MNKMVKLTAIQRIAGIIALVAVIGFSMAACDTGDGGGSGGQSNPFRGTWSGDVNGNNMTLLMTDSTWSSSSTTGGGNWSGLTGFVSYSGKTATLKRSDGDVFITGTISEDGKTLTVRTSDGATGNLTKTGSLPDW